MENADSQPPRCPCGFWGSSQTLNLCSKCYKGKLQRSGKTEDNNAEISGKKDVVQTSNRSGSKQDLGKECSSEEINTEDQCHTNSLECNTVKTETESSSLGNISQEIERDKEQQVGSSSAVGKDLPVQKKRKRCWTCKTKLELAQRELGNCRCSYVFCHLHRLPEQHNCVFDHKESGRREARSKMVSPGPKKVGRSFQRIDE